MNTYPATIDAREADAPSASPARLWVARAVWALLIVALLWPASAAFPLVVRHSSLQRRLTARIAATLGRAVEVDSYDFTFWGGPTLEAQSVRVAEDPRFGEEYFVRTESMQLRLRWGALLRGRIEPVSISLTRPSLNLVRDATGDWNLADWLPKPTAQTAAPGSFTGPVAPFKTLGAGLERITVDGGRINFKRNADKLPFALVDVAGSADTDHSGRWRIDLTATPWRAAVATQQAGILHAAGFVGGTSSRLWPASLSVTWSGAALSDVLRLARIDDVGVRGDFAASLDATTHSDDGAWTLDARVQADQIHRWDLALRPDNPAVNLYTKTTWRPTDSAVALTDVRFEMPRSRGRFSLKVLPGSSAAVRSNISPLSFEVPPSQISAADLLAWIRAFHSGIANDLAANGFFAIQATGEGWPARLLNANASSTGVTLAGLSLASPVRIGAFHARLDDGVLFLPPVAISFGSADDALEVEVSSKSGRGRASVLRVSGGVSDAHALTATARAVGWDVAHGWDMVGPVRGDVQWQSPRGSDLRAPRDWPAGFVEWGAPGELASLRVPFLNLPVAGIKARLDLKPGARQVAVSSAQALGARWTGILENRNGYGEWKFSLAADRIAAADLDRWINPRWRASFLNRMFPFLSAPALAASASPAARGSGHLALGQFNLGSWVLNRVDTSVSLERRHIELTDASAQLYGGSVSGSFSADLNPQPSYSAELNFVRVDLSSLTASLPNLSGLFDGAASGDLTLRAHGAARADLLAGLTCAGSARVASAQLLRMDLAASLAAAHFVPGTSHFPSAAGEFSCGDQAVKLDNVIFTLPTAEWRGAGAVDFSRRVDFALHRADQPGAAAIHVSGTLASPQAAAIQPARRPR